MDLTSELERLREGAESYYMGGDFRCAETVMKVILENFETEMPESKRRPPTWSSICSPSSTKPLAAPAKKTRSEMTMNVKNE